MAYTRGRIRGLTTALAALGVLLGLVLPNSASATTAEAGTFVMGIGGTPHVSVNNENFATSGIAVNGTLDGWRLEIVAWENNASDCSPSGCPWLDMRFYLSKGNDAMWGGCFRDSSGFCSTGGRDFRGGVDMPVWIGGGAGRYSGVHGPGSLKAFLEPPPGSPIGTNGVGEVRLWMSLQ